MTNSLDRLRRSAKALRRDHLAHSPDVVLRIKQQPLRAGGTRVRHADYLHVVAPENGYSSWPHLKFEGESQGFSRAEE